MMKAAVNLCLLSLCLLPLVTCGSRATEAPEAGFAVYLLAQDIPAGQLASRSPATLPLRETPIISSVDIVAYDPAIHEIELTPAAYQRIQALFGSPVPVTGVPFVVAVGREAVYAGAFWTPLSSAIFDGVTIMQPFSTDRPVIRLELGYPSPAYAGPDPRSDWRVVTALKAAGKLKGGGAGVVLDVFSGRPNPTWILVAGDAATLRDMIADLPETDPVQLPDPLGYRGFYASWLAESGSMVTVRAFRGVIQRTEEQTHFYADTDGSVERWLLDTARRYIEPGLYDTVWAEIQ